MRWNRYTKLCVWNILGYGVEIANKRVVHKLARTNKFEFYVKLRHRSTLILFNCTKYNGMHMDSLYSLYKIGIRINIFVSYSLY